jgi:hypothetical protein
VDRSITWPWRLLYPASPCSRACMCMWPRPRTSHPSASQLGCHQRRQVSDASWAGGKVVLGLQMPIIYTGVRDSELAGGL